METSAFNAIVTSVSIFALWRLIRFIVTRGSLSYIPGPASNSWLKGHFARFNSPDGLGFHKELYQRYGGIARLDMPLGEQQLSVADPLALHHILVKEQYIYEESEPFLVTFHLLFGPSLLATLGEAHKKQRKMLNPVFSIKHMRDLLSVFYPIAYELCNVLDKEVSKGEHDIDIMNWISRAALEYIGQGGLGYSFNALNEQGTNAYSDALRDITPLLFKLSFSRLLLPYAVKLGPASLRRKLVELIPSGDYKTVVDVTNKIEGYSKDILQGKRDALAKGDAAVHAQIGSGKDILSILMKANAAGNGTTVVPEEELLAHMSTFISAGHDTTASAVCRILYVLSRHQEEQSKLREEVTAARKEHGDLDYDALMALPFLDAVCRETLRVHPPATHVNRITKEATVLPLLWPIKATDGKEIKEIPLKKGTTVNISILGANMSKAIWGEDAEEWKPERWLKPLPKSVEQAHLPGVYSQMMTFLGGGRACIGFKFSEMEMKLVLCMLLEKFIFEPGPEINWQLGAVQHPVVIGSGSNRAQVPMKVSRVIN